MISRSQSPQSPKKPFACTFSGCYQSFYTPEDLIDHKIDDDDHDYCDICDEDFEDWDSLFAHKVRSEDHICCNFCGLDFRTVIARDRHINTEHPVKCHVKCCGCRQVFSRGSSLINHFEREECPKITPELLYGHIQHKKLVYNVMNDPNKLEEWRRNANLAQSSYDIGGGIRSQKVTDQHLTTNSKSASYKLAKLKNDSSNGNGQINNQRDNIFKARLWDPTSHDFNPEKFRDLVTNFYVCPFPRCSAEIREPEQTYNYDDNSCRNSTRRLQLHREAFEDHIHLYHRVNDTRCPNCNKEFGSTSALITHCESPLLNCKIQSNSKFPQVIDMLSGGFLSVEVDVPRPDIDYATVKTNIGYIRWKGAKPSAWNEGEGRTRLMTWADRGFHS